MNTLVVFVFLAIATSFVISDEIDDVEEILEDASKRLDSLRQDKYHDEKDRVFDEDIDDKEVVTIGDLRNLIKRDPSKPVANGWLRIRIRRARRYIPILVPIVGKKKDTKSAV